MPLVPINLSGEEIADPSEVRSALVTALTDLAPHQPIIVMIHGYKHAPTSPEHTPHNHIFSLAPHADWKAVSWPGLLGADAPHGQGPLCIALGWNARGNLWQAYDAAAEAGRGLAQVIRLVRALRPGTQVQVLAHSLGARVALSALPHIPAGAMGRAVLLAGAELWSVAERALATPAGRTVEVVNVTSRENAVFDQGLVHLLRPLAMFERPLGRGAKAGRAGWTDLRIDRDEVRAALADLGFVIPAATRVMCHWSVYLRVGVFPVYRALLSGALAPADLARRVSAQTTAPPTRPRILGGLALPFSGRAAS